MTTSSSQRILFRGGAVHTPGSPAATAFCVDGGTIVWLGTDDGIEPYANGADQIVALGGRLVTPAFVDAHVHLSQAGLRLAGLDLADARRREDLLDALAAYARTNSDAVILGFGWDETGWPDPRIPSGTELERATPGRAVYLARVDVHSGLVSGALLDRAPELVRAPGWDGTSRVEREAHHAARDAAMALVTRTQRKDAIVAALAAAAAVGIGSVHEMAAPHVNPVDDLALLDEVAGERPIPTVVRYWGEHASTGGVERARALGCAGAAGDLCADGAFGSRTAALLAPYADRPGHAGHGYLDAEEIAEHLIVCTRAGLQGGFHCIGDAATSAVVEGFRLAEKAVGADQLVASRHRLEHVELIAPELVRALAAYGVVVSGQPAFDAEWGGREGMYAARLGPDRALAANPWAAFLSAGVPLAFGSDAPVTPFDPWGGVRAAAYHHNPEHRIDVSAAFDAHTRGGWYAAGHDDGGTLRVGGEATFAVWDRTGPGLPPLTPGAPTPGCVRTVVAGQTVYDRERP
ncbi:amidohydrolase [Actinopolymorpha alba]|uniref:amidohydrolase n=1 Tax=Actinopolymorpha alba TaxID=533267 RepID=UPI0003801BBF|nr:amidohydrolase family protein [Actinopolymorpha alba]